MFELDFGLMIWTCLSFLILVVLLNKLAYKPLLNVISAREDTIRKAGEESEKARISAEKMAEERDKELSKARLQVKNIIGDGKSTGESLRKGIIAKAEEEAGQIRNKAGADIDKEVEGAVSGLQTEIGKLSVQIASKIINKEINKKDYVSV